MEIDIFCHFWSNISARVFTIKAENFIIHSKIQELQHELKEKNFDKIQIQLNTDEPDAIRIENNKSDEKDAANINFVKEYPDSQT